MLKLLIAAFLLFSTASFAQSISSEEAKMLANKLAKAKADTGQINILLKLAKYQVLKPGENKIDLDSAADFIKKAKNINTTIRSTWAEGYILLVQSYLLKERGQPDQSKETAGNAVNILSKGSDKLLLAESYFRLADCYGYNDEKELNERIRLMETALSYYQQTNNTERIGTCHYVLGDLYQVHDEYPKALQHLRQALSAYDSAKYARVQGVYTLMGNIYVGQGDFRQALNYGLLALKTAENVGDTSLQLCQINNGIGRTFVRLNERQKATTYFNQALKIGEKYKDTGAVYVVAANMANNWASLGNAHECLRILTSIAAKYGKPIDPTVAFNMARGYITSYSLLKQYDKAESYCNELLHMLDQKEMGIFTPIEVYAVVSKFYISSGQYSLAAKYLDKHKKLSEQKNDFSLMAANHQLWFMLDTAQDNYSAAVDHLLNYNRLNDSLFNETKIKQIAELQIQYETEKKEKDILVKNQNIQILTKQDELQKSKLQKEAITRNISFAVAGLLAIILTLLYSRYKLKQRTNKKLELQQQEIAKKNLSLQHLLNEKDWLVKEIHHRVKNNLQIVMSLLNSQSAYIDNDAALTAIHDSQHRVHAMSLIHQKLYNSENVSAIDISFYVRELVSYLADSFNTGQRIRFEYNIESLQMDVSQAVPLGLILNEAITNSIKYAFPSERSGVIAISLTTTFPNHCLLHISDDGIGIPPQFANKRPGSLGMSLMMGLTEDLDGKFSIENNNGTTIKISFMNDFGAKRSGNLSESLVSNN
jgi:two-component sensor histidine kinase